MENELFKDNSKQGGNSSEMEEEHRELVQLRETVRVEFEKNKMLRFKAG